MNAFAPPALLPHPGLAAASAPGLRQPEPAASLRAHLQECRAAQGRWLWASMAAERLHGLMAPRFVSTVAVGAVLLAAAASWA